MEKMVLLAGFILLGCLFLAVGYLVITTLGKTVWESDDE